MEAAKIEIMTAITVLNTAVTVLNNYHVLIMLHANILLKSLQVS